MRKNHDHHIDALRYSFYSIKYVQKNKWYKKIWMFIKEMDIINILLTVILVLLVAIMFLVYLDMSLLKIK